jgi:hypothetical protein
MLFLPDWNKPTLRCIVLGHRWTQDEGTFDYWAYPYCDYCGGDLYGPDNDWRFAGACSPSLYVLRRWRRIIALFRWRRLKCDICNKWKLPRHRCKWGEDEIPF